jgi:hypothetical protein
MFVLAGEAAAAGCRKALCWANPGWPALSANIVPHRPASSLCNGELRLIFDDFIAFLSWGEFRVGSRKGCGT